MLWEDSTSYSPSWHPHVLVYFTCFMEPRGAEEAVISRMFLRPQKKAKCKTQNHLFLLVLQSVMNQWSAQVLGKELVRNVNVSWNKNLKLKNGSEEGVCALMVFMVGLGAFCPKRRTSKHCYVLGCVWKLRKTTWYFLWRLPFLAIAVINIKLSNEKRNWGINKAGLTRYQLGCLSPILKCRKTILKEYSH